MESILIYTFVYIHIHIFVLKKHKCDHTICSFYNALYYLNNSFWRSFYFHTHRSRSTFFSTCKIFHGIDALFIFNYLATGKYLGFLIFSITSNLAFNIPERIILHLRHTRFAKIGIVQLKNMDIFYIHGYFLTALQKGSINLSSYH